jgi:adenylosuccinate synthase
MKNYIRFIEEKTGAKVVIISLGASREDTKLLGRF